MQGSCVGRGKRGLFGQGRCVGRGLRKGQGSSEGLGRWEVCGEGFEEEAHARRERGRGMGEWREARASGEWMRVPLARDGGGWGTGVGHRRLDMVAPTCCAASPPTAMPPHPRREPTARGTVTPHQPQWHAIRAAHLREGVGQVLDAAVIVPRNDRRERVDDDGTNHRAEEALHADEQPGRGGGGAGHDFLLVHVLQRLHEGACDRQADADGQVRSGGPDRFAADGRGVSVEHARGADQRDSQRDDADPPPHVG
eukprot:scaffold5854_cov106-Isochrysis_galbana.AAC.1